MMPGSGSAPHRGDPGGPGGGGNSPRNMFQGTYAGQRLPTYMDKEGIAGSLQVLKMQAVGENTSLPNDPFLLRLSVEKCVGGPIDGAFKENRGISYALKVRSNVQFQKLLKMNRLIDGTEVMITEHPQLNTTKCVVSNYDSVGLSDAYLKEQLASQGVRDIRRIQKRNSAGVPENTPTMILSIVGTVIPEHIDFGWTRCKTRSFYPSPMLCYHCWEYGHTRKRCQETHQICGTCSQVHPEDNILNGSNSRNAEDDEFSNKKPHCTNHPFCKNCKSNGHAVSSRKCPVYSKETAIQHIRIDMGYSYPQARREYEAQQGATGNSGSYARIANLSKDKEIADMSDVVKKLQDDSKRKDEKIAELEKIVQNRSVGKRMDQVQKNGTIEDLTRRVIQLTEAVEQLQKTVQEKDREISRLRQYETLYTHMEPSQSITTVSQSLVPTPDCASIPATPVAPYDLRDPRIRSRCSKWIAENNSSENGPAQNTKNNRRKQKHRKQYESNKDRGFSSEESMKSFHSKNSMQTTTSVGTSASNPTKRNHPTTDSNSDSNSRTSKSKRSGVDGTDTIEIE